jgi:predicted dehydrogenase
MPAKVKLPVRVAIIGCGGISGAHVKGFITYNDKLRVTALCDIKPEALKKRSESLCGIAKQFTDWKVMFKEMVDEIDAVDICLPHDLHGPAILAAAAAGKHIICEKPMCISLAEADAIATAVKNAGVTYMSAHNQLFMPVVKEAKRLIDAGELGRIMYIKSQDCFVAGQITREHWGWRADLKTQGGGELIDTGYHPAYRLLHLAGSPAVEVRGSMARFRQPIDGEDTASVSVRFANGIIGEILTSWAMNNPWGTHQIHVVGEKGQLFGSENTLYFLPMHYSEPAKRTFPNVDTFEAELGHFADVLEKGERPIHSVEEGRAVLELILKASESAKGWQG